MHTYQDVSYCFKVVEADGMAKQELAACASVAVEELGEPA
jgi:hypothetical protein